MWLSICKIANRHFKRPLSKRYFSSRIYDSDESDNLDFNEIGIDDIDKLLQDDYVSEGIKTYYPNLNIHHDKPKQSLDTKKIMVVQPWVGLHKMETFTTPEIQLDECVSLANTLNNWTVVGKKIVRAKTDTRKTVFTEEIYQNLKDEILSMKTVNGIVIGKEILSGAQRSIMEYDFKLPVYDRFTTVLNIFRQHAKTKEAKIQVALAEIPYIKQHLREIHESNEYRSAYESMKFLLGGLGATFYHRKLAILRKREIKLKKLLIQLREQRHITRKNRVKQNLPTVSLVGYTNCGKTTLTRYLTKDERIMPLDQLFATLDVTVHRGQLPSSKDVIYVDTVGFISRIPSLLVEAFKETLREVVESDVIVHVVDVSHPDYKLQFKTVNDALMNLKVPQKLMKTKLVVGNKLDKVTSAFDKNLPICDIYISATDGTNCIKLAEKIDNILLKNLDTKLYSINVSNGGSDYQWLMKNCKIIDAQCDPDDANILVCKCYLKAEQLGRIRKKFGPELKLFEDQVDS